MNLSVNPAGQNINNRNSVNFGMAVKIDDNAIPVMKRQAATLVGEARDAFWKTFDDTVESQKENPINIIIRKARGRQALAAEVVDNSAAPLPNKVFSQDWGSADGKHLNFLTSAEVHANGLNDMNNRLANYTRATKADYKATEIIDGKIFNIDA